MAINKVANKPSKSHAGLRNVIEYVLRNSKTSQDLVDVVGPCNKDIIRAYSLLEVTNDSINTDKR